ncbi:MAG TPA: hypothetical protein VGA29_07915 [Ignavibacteriaceae bacterium]|jgi:hypothetical protein
MGEIVFWTIIRLAVSIPLVWVLKDYLDYSVWWITVVFILYGVVLHPAILAYRKFEEKNKDTIDNSLCSSCKHFDKSAVLCIKYDDHPNQNYIPCNSLDWEPKNFESE